MSIRTFFIFIFSLLQTVICAQEQEETKLKNRIAPLLGYVFVPEEVENESGKFRLVPTFGLDYERMITDKFSIGLFNDFEASAYFIKDPEAEEGVLEREYVFITTLCLIYSPVERWTVYVGGGYEFEVHENFAVLRLGSEYEIPIRNNWDVAFGLSWDHKQIYNSVGFTVAFGKRF
jgi:hypothetical protein